MRIMWIKTLLLSFLSCACQADTCVVGVFGESAYLPCLYNRRENLTSLNFSFEWRRGAEVVYKAVWTEGHEKTINMDVRDRATVSSLAQTGNFTMKLSDIRFSDAQNYSLHVNNLQDHGYNALICTVCLNVTDSKEHPDCHSKVWNHGYIYKYDAGVKSSHEYKPAFIWILSIVLCVLVTGLVTITLCFQKKWDRQARRERQDDSDWEDTEMIMMDGEHLDGPPNRDRCVK